MSLLDTVLGKPQTKFFFSGPIWIFGLMPFKIKRTRAGSDPQKNREKIVSKNYLIFFLTFPI